MIAYQIASELLEGWKRSSDGVICCYQFKCCIFILLVHVPVCISFIYSMYKYIQYTYKIRTQCGLNVCAAHFSIQTKFCIHRCQNLKVSKHNACMWVSVCVYLGIVFTFTFRTISTARKSNILRGANATTNNT